MNRLTAAVLACAVVASGLAVAAAGRSPDQPAVRTGSLVTVATSKAALVCPESPPNDKTNTTVFAVTPTHRPGQRAGSVDISTLSEDAPQTVGMLDAPGEVFDTELTPEQGPAVIVSSEGGLAAGLSAAQWSTTDDDSRSGLAVSACGPGADEFWFPGASTEVGSTTRLILSNPTPAISIVDLAFYSKDGVVKTVGERGIALAPESRQSLDLAQFAPGLDPVTVRVTASTGRVVAALHSDVVDGVTPVGSEWVAPSAVPADDVVVGAGVEVGDGDGASQQLQITNPGDRQALVQIQVVDTSGPFTPTGYEDVTIPPGSVRTKDLGAVTEGAALAVHLSSTVPVTGAIVTTSAKDFDFGLTGVSPVLTDPAVVPVIPDVDLSLLFATGSRTSGEVTIEGFGAGGNRLSSQDVNVKGLATTTWVPPKAKKAKPAYYVVTVTVDAAIQASAHYAGDDGISSAPVVSGAYTVSRPTVHPTH